MHYFLIKRALTLLLAASLVFAPLAPAFAMAAGGGEAHGAHASQGVDHDLSGSFQDHPPSKSCTDHDSCAGQCCAGCAHCFGAVSLVQPVYIPFQAMQTPVLSQLHSFDLIASPDRPPRSFSL